MKIDFTGIAETPICEFSASYGKDEIYAYIRYVRFYLSKGKNIAAALLVIFCAAAFITKFYLVGIICAVGFIALVLPVLAMKGSAEKSELKCERKYSFYKDFFTALSDSSAYRISYDKIKYTEKYGCIMLFLPDNSAFVFKKSDFDLCSIIGKGK